MSELPPVPVPRTSPHEEGKPTKKPIPLPRKKGPKSAQGSTAEDSASAEGIDTCPQDEAPCIFNRGVKSLRDSFKSKNSSKSSENSQDKGKSVGLFEYSVRTLAKRLSVSSTHSNVSSGAADGNVDNRENCSDLPSEDIFHSISFHSPLSNNLLEQADYDSVNSVFNEDDLDNTSGGPPVYPPPPLPDDSFYDEVQFGSTLTDSSYEPYYSCSSVSASDSNTDSGNVYEDVAIGDWKSSHGDNDSVSLSLFQVSDTDFSSTRNSVSSSGTNKTRTVLSSDSWNFYDTVNAESEDCEQGNENADNSDNCSNASAPSNIYERDPTCFGKIPAPIDASSPAHSDFDLYSLINKFGDLSKGAQNSNCGSPTSIGTVNSVLSQNESCDDWECRSSRSTDSANSLGISGLFKRQEKPLRSFPTKSVIYEFDPLYESIFSNQISSGDKKSEDLRAVFDTVSTSNINTQSNDGGLKSNYGKINKVAGVLKQNSIELPPKKVPPIPPRRFDSITSESVVITPKLDDKSSASECYTNSQVEIESEPQSPSNFNIQTQNEAAIPENSSVVHNAQLPELNSSETKVGFLRHSPKLRWSNMKKMIRSKVLSNIESLDASLSLSSVAQQLREASNAVHPRQQATQSVFYDGMKPPSTDATHSIKHSGVIYQSSNKKDFIQRWGVLGDGKIDFFQDKSSGLVKLTLPLEKILSVQFTPEHRISPELQDLSCFEINTSLKGRSYMFGCVNSTERRIWMQKIADSLTKSFPVRLASDYIRAGWAYMKEGISGCWALGWLAVKDRSLYYYIQNSLQEADLRKARCIKLQDLQRDTHCPCAAEKGPIILIDLLGQVLYLQMELVKETKAWQKCITAAAVNNGTCLNEQQLTQEDIPTIVHKCIKFVYTHGSLSEGIYRRSGSNSNTTKLLSLFHDDAWAVQLTIEEYSEHDVASVLKRFFRILPEPLLTNALYSQFCETTDVKNEEERLVYYKRLLEQLPPINYLTLRKVIGHLRFIHEQHEDNLMPVENLAAIWGPTLMHTEERESMSWTRFETAVVSDLIKMYPQLFEVNDAELERERQLQEALKRLHNIENPMQNKPSGDFKIWVYLKEHSSGNCVNITVTPQKLAGDVCVELADKVGMEVRDITIEEVVCSGSLVRPLHYSEHVLDVVSRWGYWDKADCKDNYLVLRKNTMYKDVLPLAKPPLSASGELRFADQKTKSFRKYLFEFSQAKLCYYKDNRGSIKLGEWKIEDIVWYIGFEEKRNPQSRWAITFINKNGTAKRSKEFPYFGCTFAGTSKEEQLRWMAAMLIGEYPQGLTSPHSVNLLG